VHFAPHDTTLILRALVQHVWATALHVFLQIFVLVVMMVILYWAIIGKVFVWNASLHVLHVWALLISVLPVLLATL
jgi:hypothetical protein